MEFTKETAQQSRKLIKAMITLGKKSDGQVNELFEIFKPVIHGHDEKAFKAFQSEVCKAAGFENAKQVTEAGCNRFAITVSEFKRYCKEFSGKPESRADMYAELKAAAQAKNKTASGSDGQKPDTTPQSGNETEAAAPKLNIHSPIIAHFINVIGTLSPEQQMQIAGMKVSDSDPVTILEIMTQEAEKLRK
jgi:hypothetical protein